MTAQEILERAARSIGHGTIYKLGQGGFSPASPHPWNSRGECDCSGFVAWCLGVSRHTDHPWYSQQNGGWLETTAIARDARLAGAGMFDLVPWEQARPADLLVYGDWGGHQGHVARYIELLEVAP
jgi:cell wall-associated NlpC family hydrolase